MRPVSDLAARNLDRALLDNASEGHTAKVRALLDEGAWTWARDAGGRTSLHLAVWNGHLETVRLLCERGAGLEVADQEGWTPLHQAVLGRWEAVMHLLLDQGADIEGRGEAGQTPLHLGSCLDRSNTDIVYCLLRRGACLEAKDEDGKTPLRRAIESGVSTHARLLIAAGARPSPRWTTLSATPHCMIEMDRVVNLDPLAAATETGYLDLLKRAVEKLQPLCSEKERVARLHVAARHAVDRQRPEAAAFLKALLAFDTIRASERDVLVVRPL